MKNILIIVICFCFACNEKTSDLKQNNSLNKTTLDNNDSTKNLEVVSSHKFNGIKLLKSVIDAENQTNENKSVKIFDKNSIETLLFIKELFPTEEIDSIEIYGKNTNQKTLSLNIPENSLLTIYFNHKRLAKNQLNLIQYEWNYNNKSANSFYKRGVITFELDGQLCIYAVNSCINNGKLIESIDSKIKTKLNQNSYSYERILTTCESISFMRKTN